MVASYTDLALAIESAVKELCSKYKCTYLIDSSVVNNLITVKFRYLLTKNGLSAHTIDIGRYLDEYRNAETLRMAVRIDIERQLLDNWMNLLRR